MEVKLKYIFVVITMFLTLTMSSVKLIAPTVATGSWYLVIGPIVIFLVLWGLWGSLVIFRDYIMSVIERMEG